MNQLEAFDAKSKAHKLARKMAESQKDFIPVVIDSKTTVYVKPGKDIEAVKAKWSNYLKIPVVAIEADENF